MIERRGVTKAWGRTSRMGKTTEHLECPFCHADVLVYVWSFRGGGKKCRCGAMLSSSGATKEVADLDPTPDPAPTATVPEK